MKGLFKFFKVLALLASCLGMMLLAIQGVVIELIGEDIFSFTSADGKSFFYANKLMTITVFAVMLYLGFYFLERLVEREKTLLRILGGVLFRAALMVLLVWISKKALGAVVQLALSKSAAEQEEFLWMLLGPAVIVFLLLLFGVACNAADRNHRPRAGGYYEAAPAASAPAREENASSGTKIEKRFSRNAWMEKDGCRYIYVNCFHDNHGEFHTIDDGDFDSALEKFSYENEQRYWNTLSVSDTSRGIIYGSDGQKGYRGLGNWITDGKGQTFVLRK